jgi:epoxyqueuosine reductase
MPRDNYAERGDPAPPTGPAELIHPASPANRGAYTGEIIRVGLAAGLDAVGIAPAEPMLRARRAIRDRVAHGFDDGMQFTYRNPDRSTDPARAVRGARSMVVGARWYGGADDPPTPAGHGRLARYARADHYGALRLSLGAVRDRLRADGHAAVAVADDNSLVDREAAHLAGVGWFGKNANILVRGFGSWVVLGAVITTAGLDPSPGPVEDGCGTCRRCIDSCPTGAIVEPGVVDASRCLSWLAQKPGPFDPRFREALGDRLYGCDDCQDPCPPARVAVARREGASGAAASIDVVALLEGSDEEVLAAMGRAYVAERNPDWVRRNALIVLGNSDVRDRRAVDVARHYVHHANPVLREQAQWTLDRMGHSAGCKD